MIVRDINNCANGSFVEKIDERKKNKAIFTILPPDGTW
jgi:hypothetical protein